MVAHVYLQKGCVIPRDLPHEAEALEDTLDVDIFNPPRADRVDGSDTYLRSTTPPA